MNIIRLTYFKKAPKKSDFIKTRKPNYSLKNENFEKLMNQQFDEDKKIIRKPKEILFIGN